MGWPSQMVFVRHGESIKNALNGGKLLYKGKIPTHLIPLTERGERQATLTREYLEAKYGEFDAHLSSYYLRAKATLKVMYPNIRPFEMAMLAEGQTGIWDSMSEEEVHKAYPCEAARKELEGWYHYRPIGGESFLDIESRVINFLMVLQTYFARKRVLIIMHGNWFGMFKKIVHHLTIEESLEVLNQGHENCSVTSYESHVNGSVAQIKNMEDGTVPWRGKL